MFEEVTGLGDGGVLNVNRRHVESVTLTPDAPVGPAERHNTVLRTLPPIAVASAHSTAPHARAANEVMLDAHGQRRGEVLGPISDDLLTSRGGAHRGIHRGPAAARTRRRAGGGLLRGFLSALGPIGGHPLGHRILLFGRHRSALPRRLGVGRGLRDRGGRSRRPPRGGAPSRGLRRRGGGPEDRGSGVDGASATALQPPPHLLTTLPAPGRKVPPPRRSAHATVSSQPPALRPVDELTSTRTRRRRGRSPPAAAPRRSAARAKSLRPPGSPAAPPAGRWERSRRRSA